MKKEKSTYLIPVCEILQTDVFSSFLVTSDGIEPWEEDNVDPYNF